MTTRSSSLVLPDAPDTNTVWSLLQQRLFNGMRRHFGSVLQALDLSAGQARLLWAMDTDGGLSQKEAAQRLECDPSNIVGLADSLEARGLLERRTAAKDRRIKTLTLTQRGQTLRRELLARSMAAPDWLTPLSPDEARLLYELLAKLLSEVSDTPSWM